MKRIHNELIWQKWQEFRINDVFEVFKSQSYHLNTIQNNQNINNKIYYVSRTTKNNSLKLIISDKIEYQKNKNVINIGGEEIKAFYQQKPFISGNNMSCLTNSNINKYISLFFNNHIK